MGRTRSLQMKIDTGDHLSIKLKPYRTPIYKIKMVEAVKEMLEDSLIERFKSSWSFPEVVVDNTG